MDTASRVQTRSTSQKTAPQLSLGSSAMSDTAQADSSASKTSKTSVFVPAAKPPTTDVGDRLQRMLDALQFQPPGGECPDKTTTPTLFEVHTAFLQLTPTLINDLQQMILT